MKTVQKVDEILTTLGHPENLCGTEYLRAAIGLYACGCRQMTKELYPEVGKIYGTTGSRVERGIRYTIEQAMRRGDPDDWRAVFGGSISPDKGKPTNTEYIARLARLVRENG